MLLLHVFMGSWIKLKIINDLLDFNDEEIRSYIHAVIFWGFTQNVEVYME